MDASSRHPLHYSTREDALIPQPTVPNAPLLADHPFVRFISALPAANAATQSLYRSMHDLLVEAAQAGWTVHARTRNCAAPVSTARVLYLVVDP